MIHLLCNVSLLVYFYETNFAEMKIDDNLEPLNIHCTALMLVCNLLVGTLCTKFTSYFRKIQLLLNNSSDIINVILSLIIRHMVCLNFTFLISYGLFLWKNCHIMYIITFVWTWLHFWGNVSKTKNLQINFKNLQKLGVC